jgi:predicted TIM-barrel fold metal-dependent hydrolase
VIDVNVSLFRWPFRRLAGDDTAGLVATLRKHNVVQAWAGSMEGVFHKDLTSANARLAEECRRFGDGMLKPFGSINPKLPDWQEDLRRCHDEHQMPGIRLHPNYHGYDLQDPAFPELLHMAAVRRLVVQLAVRMEDERTQHPLMRVSPVDISPLANLLNSLPEARLVILNSDPLHNLEQSKELLSAGNISFDISMVEGVGGVARLAKKVSLPRVLFGTHYPLFYFESALLKVREAEFTDVERQTVLDSNANKLLTS